MPNHPGKFVRFLDYLLPWMVLPLLLLYTYLEFFHAPYLGFQVSSSTGSVQGIFIDPSLIDLQVGDIIVTVNSHSWQEARSNLRSTLLGTVRQGETYPLLVERAGEMREVAWRVPGVNVAEVQNRLFNIWLLGYIFWLAGVAVTLFVRPRSTQSRLFVAFFVITSIWLVTGNSSRWNLWEGTILFRTTIWLSVPVYVHLHWLFPKPLAKLPTGFWWILYSVAVVIALCQWFELLDRSAYLLALLLALGGSLLLLLAHYIWQPTDRSRINLLLIAFMLTLIPMLGLGIVAALGAVPEVAPAALLTLPIIPCVYYYAIYRYQLGGLEFRANRLLSLYLFFSLLGSVIAVLFALIEILPAWPSKYLLIGVFVSLLATLLGIYIFPRFQRLVEQRLLGITLPPASLLETYAARITTSLTQRDLARLLQEEILPSLLIRQSTLLLNSEGLLTPLYSTGLNESDLPESKDVISSIAQSNRYLSNSRPALPHTDTDRGEFSWILASIPIRFEERLIGFWLFGRRDPDDGYNLAELNMLQTLAHQMSIALINIEQSQQLHALYQANIDRHEIERTHLAHLLHDDILGGLSRLHNSLDRACQTKSYETAYQALKQHALQMITGLRPALLNYGIYAALEEFVDSLNERVPETTIVRLEIGPTAVQLPTQVEEYVFRIVQQASENALRYSQASTICISGEITSESVQLAVIDDGIGFDATQGLSIAHLLAHKHFGLVGMYERAKSIGAKLIIESVPSQGTSVRVIWPSSSLPASI